MKLSSKEYRQYLKTGKMPIAESKSSSPKVTTVDNDTRDRVFVTALKQLGLPEPVAEYCHIPKRKFRLDFAYPDIKMGLEIDGGIYNRKAHGSITGILRDIEKSNLGLVEGWSVLRIPNDKILDSKYLKMIEKLYKRLTDEKK